MSCREASTENVSGVVPFVFTNIAVSLYQFPAVSVTAAAGVLPVGAVTSAMLPVVRRCWNRNSYDGAGCAVDCMITVMNPCGLLSLMPAEINPGAVPAYTFVAVTKPICVAR